MNQDSTNAFLRQFAKLRVLVVGDVMLDRYVYGTVHRISPEAPVPVVQHQRTENLPGGAANVALNLRAFGARVFVAGVVGNDDAGAELCAAMQAHGIEVQHLLKVADRPTTVKMRIVAGKQQLLRVDTERTDPIGEDITTRLTEESIGRLLDTGIDAVILQDYNKGVLTEAVIEAVMRKCKATHTLVAVDPKSDNFFAYRGATLFKPNLKETREALNIRIEPEADSLLKAADLLREKLGCRDVMITLSEKGIFYQSNHETDIVATRARTIADVSGAGDTVISVATLALAAGMSLGAAARLANMAAGLVCEQPGVVAVDAERLEYSVRSSQLGAGGFEF